MDENKALANRHGIALPIWAWVVAALAASLFWAVMLEAGAVSDALGRSSLFLHEVFHDGRHLIGVPCH